MVEDAKAAEPVGERLNLSIDFDSRAIERKVMVSGKKNFQRPTTRNRRPR